MAIPMDATIGIELTYGRIFRNEGLSNFMCNFIIVDGLLEEGFDAKPALNQIRTKALHSLVELYLVVKGVWELYIVRIGNSFVDKLRVHIGRRIHLMGLLVPWLKGMA